MTSSNGPNRPSVLDTGLLRYDSPDTGAPPFLDSNLMRMTPTCLFMRTASARVYGGRGGMSGAATVISSLFIWICAGMFYLGYASSDMAGRGLPGIIAYFLDGGWVTISMGFYLLPASFWMFIPWRRQLPLIFNRDTGVVTAEFDGRIVTQDWATLCAAAGSVRSVSADGVTLREGAISILFDMTTREGKFTRVNVNIYATEHHVDVYRYGPRHGALMVWEAIRHYMNGNDQAISTSPLPDVVYRFEKWSDPFVVYNPFQIFWSGPRWARLLAPLGLLFWLPFSAVVIPGELLYMWFDRVLPRRKWPQQMIDACGGIWDGSDD